MSEQDYEGWQVDPRPAIKALAVFVAVLLVLVVGTALAYNHLYAPRTRPHLSAFAGPVLETIDTAPSDRLPVAPPAPPPGIERAMAKTAARGNALWAQ